jgi:hypothetical protein
MCTALERIGLSKRAARRFAAAELQRVGLAQLFHSSGELSAKSIEHWKERDFPFLDPQAEQLLAIGLATAGRDPQRLSWYFIGLIQFAINPTAIAICDRGV